MTLALRYAVRSDKGLVRSNNEDSVYAGPRLLAIADGMGGHAGGEVASKIVIGALEDLDEDRRIEDLITSLRDAVEDANDSLSQAVRRDAKLDGMGTTLTALRFSGSKVGLVHVGDSRAYLLRGGQLNQITHDDTYVQSLVDAGRLTPEEASHHPRRSVILRALNGAAIEPDVSIREARHGDRYLLCTDGLTDVLRTETLLEALGTGDPQECADRLVALALRGGGPDNVTCIVADVVEADRGDDVPVVAGAVVDPGADSADDDSPAARAAGLSGRGVRILHARQRERRWPRVIVPLGIVLVLAGAAISTWIWTQSQYYVGQSADSVVVFRGVDTQVGPVKFFSVVQRSALKLSDLKPVARTKVEQGITANNRADAAAIMNRLLVDQLLPICAPAVTRSATATSGPPATTASAPPSTRITTSRTTRTTGTRTSGTRTVARRTTGTRTPARRTAAGRASTRPATPTRAVATSAVATTVVAPTGGPSPAASGSATPTTEPNPPDTGAPGTDCRTAR